MQNLLQSVFYVSNKQACLLIHPQKDFFTILLVYQFNFINKQFYSTLLFNYDNLHDMMALENIQFTFC